MLSSCTRPTAGAAAKLAGKVEWNPDFAKMRDALLSAGMKNVAAETGKRLDAEGAKAREILKCGTAEAGSRMRRDRALSLSGAARVAA